MKKFIIPFVLLVVFALLIGLGTKNSGAKKEIGCNTGSEEQEARSLIASLSNAEIPKPELSLALPSSSLADKAWGVFQSYLKSAQNHDLANLRLVSHQISDVCNDPAQEKQCFERMDSVYFIGSQFKREEFTKVWSDRKQIILATDYQQIIIPELGIDESIRGVIYFTLDEIGNPKILSLNNMEGKNSDPVGQDTDGDGWWDGIEVFFYSR